MDRSRFPILRRKIVLGDWIVYFGGEVRSESDSVFHLLLREVT